MVYGCGFKLENGEEIAYGEIPDVLILFWYN